jgi:lipopolysaccharide transport system ATP-binding protein
MNKPVLQVSKVGKAYRQYNSELSRVLNWFGLSTKPATETWVLRDISFSVSPGEAVGIVGQNGAGKSTLLKLITGTQQPTEGTISVNGRIAAILELGMGFNPEFTGRQNVYHSAGLMGFTQNEIEEMIPEIESFADVGNYFDQPLGIYSSGMQMRVGFALSTASRPQLLIVDEALSVGDAAFQRKCFRRLESYLNEGMSLLLVSHDIEGIKKTCSKALFLNQGQQKKFGDAKIVCDDYEKQLFGRGGKTGTAGEYINQENVAHKSQLDLSLHSQNEIDYGDGRARIKDVWLEDVDGNKVNILNARKSFSVNFLVHFNAKSDNPVIAFLVKTVEGIALYGIDTHLLGQFTGVYEEGDTVTFSFHFNNYLSEGTYFLNCGIKDFSDDSESFMHRRVDVLMFKVQQKKGTACAGLVDLEAKFSFNVS